MPLPSNRSRSLRLPMAAACLAVWTLLNAPPGLPASEPTSRPTSQPAQRPGPLAGRDPAGLTGHEIMTEQRRRHRVPQETLTEVLVLVDEGNQRETRVMRSYSKEVPTDDAKADSTKRTNSLVVFDLPEKVRGTALLTWEQLDRDDDQWLYLPSQHKTVRIATGSRGGYFMGTDFTYEDLEPERVEEYRYERMADESFGGHPCFVLIARPIGEDKKKSSAYACRKLWLRQDLFFAVKVEYYDRRDRHIKTMTCHELFQVEGAEQTYRPRKVVMDNPSRKHKTLRGIKTVDLKTPIGDDLFTRRYIQAERHVR